MPLRAHRIGRILGRALLAAALLAFAIPSAKAEEDVWPSLKQATFGDRVMAWSRSTLR